MRKFDYIVETAISKRKEYQKKYQLKQREKKKKAMMTEFEPRVRNEVNITDAPLPENPTLKDLVGRIVNFDLKTGESLKGIVQEPREDILDRNALRVFSLGEFGVRMIPKKMITKAMVGSTEVQLQAAPKTPGAAGEFEVPGSKGNVYTVKHDGYDNWTCTCPAYKWKKGDCKHVSAMKDKVNN